MKEISNFLLGYFYAAWQNRRNYDIDNNLNQCLIYTKKGGRLIFAINRGIAHVDGNVAHAFKDSENSLFDIVKDWTTKEIWNYMKTFYDVEHDEVRINFEALCYIIYCFGGFDFDKMKFETIIF
jgi:hypothetical protein